jgi:excisionase family DNA binding protein
MDSTDFEQESGDDAPTLEYVRPASPQIAAAEVLTADAAATLLGVSIWTLYAAANRHEIPHRRIGRRMLFSRHALLEWLRAGPRRPERR